MPGLKALWKSGDLREKLVASTAKISSVRTRWQVRGYAQIFWRWVVLTTIHPCPDATASLHTRINERDPWANGLYPDRNDSYVSTGPHNAPAGAGPPTLS